MKNFANIYVGDGFIMRHEQSEWGMRGKNAGNWVASIAIEMFTKMY